MNKSENLIVRIDPDLKKVIDLKAEEEGITTSEMVREFLSLIFLVDYENRKFAEYIRKRMLENKMVLSQIINTPLVAEEDKQKILAKKNIELCSELLKVIENKLS